MKAPSFQSLSTLPAYKDHHFFHQKLVLPDNKIINNKIIIIIPKKIHPKQLNPSALYCELLSTKTNKRRTNINKIHNDHPFDKLISSVSGEVGQHHDGIRNFWPENCHGVGQCIPFWLGCCADFSTRSMYVLISIGLYSVCFKV